MRRFPLKKAVLTLVAVVGLVVVTSGSASAARYYYGYSVGAYPRVYSSVTVHPRIIVTPPITVHPPFPHVDRVYHPTELHWTPNRGWHTHGHYDYVPHTHFGF